MKELFLPYELAVIAKEKGFNEPCLAIYSKSKILSMESNNPTGEYYFYNKDLLAPLYQQIVDWLREKHDIYISPDIRHKFLVVRVWSKRPPHHHIGEGATPQEALNKAITEAFKLI